MAKRQDKSVEQCCTSVPGKVNTWLGNRGSACMLADSFADRDKCGRTRPAKYQLLAAPPPACLTADRARAERRAANSK